MRKPKHSLTRASSAIAAALFLAGCATLEPPLPEAQPDIQADWPIPSRTDAADTSSADPSAALADIGWRDFFADASLDNLIAQALENNRDLRVAILNVERARSLYRIQRSALVPSVGASGSMTRTGGDGQTPFTPDEYYRADLGLAEYEIDLFGRVRNLSEAALQQFLATEAARRSAQLALIAEVANAYLTLAADLELQRIAVATLAAFEEEFQLTEERFRLGATSPLEVSQARTIVERARADAARFDGQVVSDVNALRLLVGGVLHESELPETFDPEVSGLSSLPVGLPSDVLLRRPDVQQAELLLRAANANIGAARAAFFPSISLTASVGTASDELSNLFGSGTDVWSFSPRVNLPIFQGGRLRANRDVAVADRDIALARYERSIQSGFREVADALALSRTLTTQREAMQAMVEAAAEAQDLSERRYRAGQDGYIVLLDAQRTLYAARQSLVAAQLAEQSNRVDLYKALGGGWEEAK